MKNRLALALFSLCLPLALGGSSPAYPGYFESGLVLTVSTSETTRLTLNFVASYEGHYRISALLNNALTGNQKYLYTDEKDMVPGEKWSVDEPVSNSSLTPISSTDNAITINAFYLYGAMSSMGISETRQIDALSTRGMAGATGSQTLVTPDQYLYVDESGKFCTCGSTYSFVHDHSFVCNPEYNRLPLEDLKIAYSNPAQPNLSGAFEIRIQNHLDEFDQIGTLVKDPNAPYRRLTGVFKKAGGDLHYPYQVSLYNRYAIDKRNLRMKLTRYKTGYDFTDNRIYLPSGLGQVYSFYSFAVYCHDLGASKDYFKWNFTLVRTEEHFGDCVNSDYCIVVSGADHA